jgi:outer membrane protein
MKQGVTFFYETRGDLMINYLEVKKRVGHLLIVLFSVALLSAPVSSAESPLLISESGIADASSSKETSVAGNPTIGILNRPGVFIRQGPGLNEKIIGYILKKGTVIEILSREGEWIKVYYNNAPAWVHAEYIDIKEEASPATNGEKTAAPPADSQLEGAEAQTESTETTKKHKSAVLQGQSDGKKDLMQFYRLAQQDDPAFQSEKYRHAASPEIYKQALSEYLPSVTADAYYRKTREEIKSTDIAVYGEGKENYPSDSYSLSLTQPVVRYSSIMRILQAKEEVKSADFKFEAAKQDMILRVADTYIGVLKAYDNLEFTRTKEESLKLYFELARERYDSGLAPITDYHDAKARLSSVMADRVMAEDVLDDALEGLAEVSGQEIHTIARLKYVRTESKSDDFPIAGAERDIGGEYEMDQGVIPMVSPDPDDVDDWIEAALKQNLEVQVRRQAVLIARREIKRQKGGHWPTLDLVGKMGREYEGGSLYGGSSEVESSVAMLKFSLPLYQGSSVVSKVRETLKLYSAAEQDLEKEIRLVKRETKSAFLGVKSAIKNTEALKQSVVSNQIALEAKKEGFRAGLFPSVAVLDAERDLHLAKLEYAEAQYGYIRNSLRLKKAVGTLNQEDLAGINQWLE